MEDREVIVQATCSVSLSTEGSIIPFTPGDVYLCANDNTELWCLVVLHKRNFPRKYSIVRQLTKITIRKRGPKIGFIVIEFDDTNQVRLKDFTSDPSYIARVLEYCYENKHEPDLIQRLKNDEIKQKLLNSTTPYEPVIITISPESSSRSSFEFNKSSFDEKSTSSLDSSEFELNKNRRFSKRTIDVGCITPPVRCIASIEETRVINEADVEEIPDKDQITHNNNAKNASNADIVTYVYKQTGNNRVYRMSTPTSPAPSLHNGDSNHISSHGSTPPREFFVSEFEPNNCQADVTVSSISPEKEPSKVLKIEKLSDYPKYSTFNFPASSPPGDCSSAPRRSKRRLIGSTKRPINNGYTSSSPYEPLSKERRRILSDGTLRQNITCKRNKLITITSKRSRLKSSSSLDNIPNYSHYFYNNMYAENPYYNSKDLMTLNNNEFIINARSQSPKMLALFETKQSVTENLQPESPNTEEQTQFFTNHDKSDSEISKFTDDPDICKFADERENINHLSNHDHDVDAEVAPNGDFPEDFIQQTTPNSPVSEGASNSSKENLSSVQVNSLSQDENGKMNLRPRPEPTPPIPVPQDKVVEAENVPGTPTPHGFVNLGNTCYMNCVLQCVLTIPSFTNMLHAPHAPLPSTLYNCLSTLLHYKTNTVSDNVKKGTKEKKDLLVKIKNYVTEATSLFKGSRQQDAHEFLGKFLDVLREERRDTLKCPVYRTFQCEVIHTLRCGSCRSGGQNTEKYYDFSLNLPSRNLQPHNLAELLETYFAADVVDYVCEGCGHNSAQVQHRFSQLPEVLVLHLQRYAFSRGSSREGKRQDSILIPSKLDITNLAKDRIKDNTDSRVSIPDMNMAPGRRHLRTRAKGLYSLHAVISHLGESRECGHYICDVREGGQWYYYDDVNMHLVDLQFVRSKRKNSCYIFFYLRDT